MMRLPDKLKTSLFAAFFVAPLLVSCQQAGAPLLPEASCDSGFTAISSIQGDGAISPLLGQEHLVRGVVSFLEKEGFYIEENNSDESELTSNGLFVSAIDLLKTVALGDLLTVSGLVSELGDSRNTVTSLSEIEGFRICASNQALAASTVELPLTSRQKEAYEGMLLGFSQELTVSNVYDAAEGNLSVNTGGLLPVPTEIAHPGPDARAVLERNHLNSIDIRQAGENRPLLPAGTRILGLSGVLGHDGSGLRLLQNEALQVLQTNSQPLPAPEENSIRALGFNLLNYFNGDGTGGGFPTPRGANSSKNFEAQRVRLSSAIKLIQPHLVAVMELENDGFDENSAAADFIRDLQLATGAPWQAVIPGEGLVGSDAISVGLFYRPDVLELAGHAELLVTSEFGKRSRVPMAQTFVDLHSGEAFLVVANHLKSKGSCPQSGRNADLNDGQGCWNPARTVAAREMASWSKSLASNQAGGKALILGDMNAYRMEDPIQKIIEAGFVDLKSSSALGFEYSHMYRGQAGTLDYAFASRELKPSIRMTRILHINSSYPAGVELPQPWLRSSDHDPVVVDLRFRQASTSD
jgi:predicted extracellular nuclease